MQNFRRNKRKAISPIIATLILIVITVAAGVIVYYFVSGYASSSTAGVTSQETFIITNVLVKNNATGTNLTITVANTGNVVINITSGIVIKQSTGQTFYLFTKARPHNSILNAIVNPGQTLSIDVSVSSTNTTLTGVKLPAGQTYILQLTTTRGTTQTFSFTA